MNSSTTPNTHASLPSPTTAAKKPSVFEAELPAWLQQRTEPPPRQEPWNFDRFETIYNQEAQKFGQPRLSINIPGQVWMQRDYNLSSSKTLVGYACRTLQSNDVNHQWSLKK